MQQINRKNRVIETYSLILVDLIAILVSYAIASLIRFGTIFDIPSATLHNNVCIYLMLFCLGYSIFIEWNRHFFTRGFYIEAVAIFKYVFSMTVCVAFLLFLTHSAKDFSRLILAYFGIICCVVTWMFHIVLKMFFLEYYRKGNNSDKVMVVTDSEYIEQLVARINKVKAWNYEITAIAVLDKNMVGEMVAGIPIVAYEQDLYDVARQTTLDQVFIFLPNMSTKRVKEMIINFENMGVTCHYSVDALELDMAGKSVGNFAGYAVITFQLNYLDYRRLLLKRIMDICGSFVGLLITAILTPFVAIAIRLESKGPIFFAQTRIGKNGRRFKIYKFRSMYIDAEERKKELLEQNEMSDGLMFKMEKDPRITKVGAFLRKTSIDELPQFYNVFVGDMSLVGTRPPTEDEFEQYNLHFRRRMSITPGLTGMWQVKGRGKVLDFDQVVEMDLEYIDTWTLSLDIKILFQTVFVVLFGIGAK